MSRHSSNIEELHSAALAVAKLMQKDGCETLAPIFARLKAELDKANENTIGQAQIFLTANSRD